MFPRKKKSSATLCLSCVTTSDPVWCEPIRVWMTVARSKYSSFPCSCLPALRGTFSVVVSSRRASTTQRLRAKAGSWSHQVQEHRFLDGEQLRPLRAAGRGAARRAGEQRQLPEHLSGAEIGDGHGLRGVARQGQHLEDAALDDEEPIARVSLTKHDLAGAELVELPLGEHRLKHLGRLVLEQLGMAEEGRIDHWAHLRRPRASDYSPGGLPGLSKELC